MTLDTAVAACGDGESFQPRLGLDQQELDRWDADGFHVHEPLFSPAEVAAIAAAGERVAQRDYATGIAPDARCWEPGAPATAVLKFDNCWKSDPLLRAAATSERLGRIAAQLIGAAGMRLWHDQYLRKPGGGGYTIAWHQDHAHWQALDRPRTVTCWIALADVTAEMGPMIHVAGSHRVAQRVSSVDVPGYWTGDTMPPLPDTLAGLRPVPVLLRAGQVAFHHGLAVHGSDVNLSCRDRAAFVSHLFADDCCYVPGHPMHLHGERLRTYPVPLVAGCRFRGPEWPYAWRAV